MSLLTPEPNPTAGQGDMWAQVIGRLAPDDPLLPHCIERRQQGIDRYGVPLQTGNGRRSMRDLFQELLDAVVYAEQAITENNSAEAIEIADGIRWDSMNNARRLLRFVK